MITRKGPLKYRTLMETYLSLCVGKDHPMEMRCSATTMRKVVDLLSTLTGSNDPNVYRVWFQDAVIMPDVDVPDGEIQFMVIGATLKLKDD